MTHTDSNSYCTTVSVMHYALSATMANSGTLQPKSARQEPGFVQKMIFLIADHVKSCQLQVIQGDIVKVQTKIMVLIILQKKGSVILRFQRKCHLQRVHLIIIALALFLFVILIGFGVAGNKFKTKFSTIFMPDKANDPLKKGWGLLADFLLQMLISTEIHFM